MPSQRYRIDIITEGSGILQPGASGFSEILLAACLTVTRAGESRSYTVVRATSPPWTLTSSHESLRKLFPSDILLIVRADSSGETTVHCDAPHAERLAAAAAVATLKRSWGWDESPCIRVKFESDGLEYPVSPLFERGAWWVQDVQSA